MNRMIQPVSTMGANAVQSLAVAGVKESPKLQGPEGEAPAHLRKPVMDEYVPEEKQEASGRYWLARDEDGQPKICFDDPDRVADGPETPDGHPAPEGKKADGKKAEICRGSTDQVDREIERLKKKREELKRQIGAEADDTRRKALEQKLVQVERELSQKDNDAYRRQHTVFS